MFVVVAFVFCWCCFFVLFVLGESLFVIGCLFCFPFVFDSFFFRVSLFDYVFLIFTLSNMDRHWPNKNKETRQGNTNINKNPPLCTFCFLFFSPSCCSCFCCCFCVCCCFCLFCLFFWESLFVIGCFVLFSVCFCFFSFRVSLFDYFF